MKFAASTAFYFTHFYISCQCSITITGFTITTWFTGAHSITPVKSRVYRGSHLTTNELPGGCRSIPPGHTHPTAIFFAVHVRLCGWHTPAPNNVLSVKSFSGEGQAPEKPNNVQTAFHKRWQQAAIFVPTLTPADYPKQNSDKAKI